MRSGPNTGLLSHIVSLGWGTPQFSDAEGRGVVVGDLRVVMTADQERSKLGLGFRSRGETRHEREKNRREEEIKPRRDEKAPVPARGRAREAERTALEGSETGSNDRRRDRAAVRKK